MARNKRGSGTFVTRDPDYTRSTGKEKLSVAGRRGYYSESITLALSWESTPEDMKAFKQRMRTFRDDILIITNRSIGYNGAIILLRDGSPDHKNMIIARIQNILHQGTSPIIL